MSKKSLFIAIEGLDGSGKSSLIRYLYKILGQEHKDRIKLTFEPHDPSCGGIFIRQILTKKITNFDPKVLALAFAANRLDHCAREIDPWLVSSDRAIVLSDRYYLSSLVYQSSDALDFETVYSLNDKATRPDLIVFLNVSNKTCYERMKYRNESEELFETNLSQTRNKFHRAIDFLRKEKNENIVEVDANGALEEVADAVLTELYKLDGGLKPKKTIAPEILEDKNNTAESVTKGSYAIEDAVNDFTVPESSRERPSKEDVQAEIESNIASLKSHQIGSLFLDYIQRSGYSVGGKLPLADVDAYQVGYGLPGGLPLSGTALIIGEEQQYDILLKKVPDLPKMSDFLFVFSPGPSNLVTEYYERALLKYNADIIREGLFPAVKLVTQKVLAEAIWAAAVD